MIWVYFILKRILIVRKKDTGYNDICEKREKLKTATHLLNMFYFLFQIQSRTKQILLPVTTHWFSI